jgi:uncharacterized protein (TIGR02118 family)
MVKLVLFLHKHPDLCEEEFRRYWRDTHGPIAAKVPGLRKYVQGHQVSAVLPFPALCDGMAELWFDSVESIQSAMSSPEGQAVAADAVNCFDMARTSMLVVEEIPIG